MAEWKLETKMDQQVQSRAQADVLLHLQARLGELSVLMTRDDAAELIVDSLYWPDIVVTGEGFGRIIRGREELLPVLSEYVGVMGRDCTWTMVEPAVVTDDMVSMFIQVECRQGDAQSSDYFCPLYVWLRRGGEWKVIHEQACVAKVL
jgi:ketosteroid isomerase-like protein